MKARPLNLCLPVDTEETSAKEIIKSNTYYQNSTITISVNQDHQRVKVDWTGFQTLQSVQQGCMMMLELLQKNQCRKAINDNRHVLGTWSEASEWVGKQWMPMMEQAGLQYFAWIFSLSAFRQLSAKKSIDVMEGNVLIQFFTDIQSAEEWIDARI